jgi:hypothetical protein
VGDMYASRAFFVHRAHARRTLAISLAALLWMPGADRTREVTPSIVLDRLRQHGWQTDPDFHSHAATFKRNGVDVSVWVIPPPKPNEPPIAHVIIDVLGECRDTFDHRSDQTNSLYADIRGELTSG